MLAQKLCNMNTQPWQPSKRADQEITSFFSLQTCFSAYLFAGQGGAWDCLWATWTPSFFPKPTCSGPDPKASAWPLFPDYAGYNSAAPEGFSHLWVFMQFGSALQSFSHIWVTATFVSEKGTPNGKILSSILKSKHLNHQAARVPQLIFLPGSLMSFKKS